jgi:HD-like signal output (HDOD) protein
MESDRLHVVYIDDEQLMLNATERVMRRLKPNWLFTLISEPSEWLEIVEKTEVPPDIIISDLLMPNMSGNELLQQATQRYPSAIRAIITGHMSKDIPSLANALAHFILPKPYTDNDISQILACAERLKQLPFSAQCRAKLAGLEAVPVLPDCVSQIRRCSSDPNSNAHDLVAIVSLEPSLAARIVQLSNSAYLGFQSQTSSLETAINRLGIHIVEAVAMTMLSHKSFHNVDIQTHNRVVDDHIKLAERSTAVAQSLGHDKAQQDEVYLTALLSSLSILTLLEIGATQEQVSNFLGLEEGYSDHLVISSYILILWGYNIRLAEIVLAIDTMLTHTQVDALSNAEIIHLCNDWLIAEQNNELTDFWQTIGPELTELLTCVTE